MYPFGIIIMRTAGFLITAVLLLVCRAQEDCKIFPKNPVVPFGSNLTLFFKVPSRSVCRSKMQFNPSRILWILNKSKVDKRFYDFNSTFASVSIINLSGNSSLEVSLDSDPSVLLDGVFIHTYSLIRSPKNVSCIDKVSSQFINTVTCMWDHDQHSTDIKYTVNLKQTEEYNCTSSGGSCTFSDGTIIDYHAPLSARVIATNSFGYSASSSKLYPYGWAIFQMDSPEDVVAEALPNGLRVTWNISEKLFIRRENTRCEIRLREKDSDAEPVVKSVESGDISSLEVIWVKPCTNYSVSVRSRYIYSDTWSTWSREVTELTHLNVDRLQFHLWRLKSVLDDEGKRRVHVMWKGVPPSCKAVDGYYIFSDSRRPPECFGPYQNRTFITLEKHPHRITLAAFRRNKILNNVSIEVPAMAEEVNLPPVRNISVFVQDEWIRITWEKPRLAVSGYIIVWNSTAENHKWQHIQNTTFTLKDNRFTHYTISLTPLYKDGPGTETTLHNCIPGSHLPAVSNVIVNGFEKHAEIHWMPLLPSQCCAFVLNYTVFYKTYNESKFRNVTVEPSQYRVVLKDLQAKTTYSVYVMARTVSASSQTTPVIFSTKPSKYFLIVFVVCSMGLILLSALAVMIQRKLLSKRIPDPRFSSLSMWPSDKCKNPWSLLPVPGSRDTEKILPCHVDSEIISVSPTSKIVTAAVKTLTDIQNIAAHMEKTSEIQNTPLAASFSNKGQLPYGGKEQRVPLIPSLDLQTSGVSLKEYSLPPVQSPYRKQTPLSSPLESPTKPPWSDETEALLTPKLKNTTYFTSYVTLDMFEPEKHPAK